MKNCCSKSKSFLMLGFVAAALAGLFVIRSVTNGGTEGATLSAADKESMAREINVRFVVVNDKKVPWEFYPNDKEMKVHPGQNMTTSFHARNTTGRTMTVQAIPSMEPTDSIAHFHKIQCFCFNQQTLKGNESKDMQMIFNIDKDLPKNIGEITLTYTLIDVTPKHSNKG